MCSNILLCGSSLRAELPEKNNKSEIESVLRIPQTTSSYSDSSLQKNKQQTEIFISQSENKESPSQDENFVNGPKNLSQSKGDCIGTTFCPNISDSSTKETQLGEGPITNFNKNCTSPIEIKKDPPPHFSVGLENLATSDSLYLQHFTQNNAFKSAGLTEILGSVVPRNCFQILNDDGIALFYAVASTRYHWTLSGARPFNMFISDLNGDVVLNFYRRCSHSLLWWGGDFYGNRIVVRDRNGQVLGRIKQRLRFLCQRFVVEDVNHIQVFSISGPPSTFFPSFWKRFSKKFQISRKKGRKNRLERVGTFIQCPYGFEKEHVGNSLRVSYPLTLHLRDKALLFGALFLVYYTNYEESDIIPAKTAGSNVPLALLNGHEASNLRRMGGKIREKCNCCCSIFFYGGLIALALLLIWFFDYWKFDFIPQFLD